MLHCCALGLRAVLRMEPTACQSGTYHQCIVLGGLVCLFSRQDLPCDLGLSEKHNLIDSPASGSGVLALQGHLGPDLPSIYTSKR